MTIGAVDRKKTFAGERLKDSVMNGHGGGKVGVIKGMLGVSRGRRYGTRAVGSRRGGTKGAGAALQFLLNEMGGGDECIWGGRVLEDMDELGLCKHGGDGQGGGGRGGLGKVEEHCIRAWDIVNVNEQVGGVVTDETEGHTGGTGWGGMTPELAGGGEDFHGTETEGVGGSGEMRGVEVTTGEVVRLGEVGGGLEGDGFDSGGGES